MVIMTKWLKDMSLGLKSLEFNADSILGGYNCSSLIPQASLLAQNS